MFVYNYHDRLYGSAVQYGEARLVDADLKNLLEEAVGFDSTLEGFSQKLPEMQSCFVPPVPYTRDKLFQHQVIGEPLIATGFPVPVQPNVLNVTPGDKGQAIIQWLSKSRAPRKYRVYTGPTGVKRHLTLAEIASKWSKNTSAFGVTDLHIRETSMERLIDVEVLSQFNLFPSSTPIARFQEMFSFVIASYGYVTDSHSDAPDSSNYCFVGKKLWLAWDTEQGRRVGLQDIERTRVYGKAHFDLAAWLSLPSARWFVVEQGEALFLPAHYTHKVITLESYVGVGSFYVSLPNCLRLLEHWIIRSPLWSKGDKHDENASVLGDIAETVASSIVRLQEGSRATQNRWGYDFLEQSAKHFISTRSGADLQYLLEDTRFCKVADAIPVAWPR